MAIMCQVLVLLLDVAPGSGASLAVHPAGVAVDVMFFLPDRDAMLDFIDDESAGAKRLVAMRGAHADPDGNVTDRQRPMRCTQAARVTPNFSRPPPRCARLPFRELRERLVFQARDRVAFVVIAHPALESRETAAAIVAQLALQRRAVQRSVAEPERAERSGASSARHRRNEHHGVAGRERLRPVTELGVDRDAQHFGRQGERIFAREFHVQLARVRARVWSVSLLRPACSRSSA